MKICPMESVFWLGIAVVAYTYVGYGLFLYTFLKIFRRKKKNVYENFLPATTLVIAAYNEQEFIRQKIENSLALDYPTDKLSVLFITDGSTDKTPEIIREYGDLKLLHNNARRGKTAALNRAMDYVQTPIVIFTDANTLLNKDCIKNIVRHYADEKVGGVAGEKKVSTENNGSATAGEGIYWKYESFLKKMDSEFYTVVGAAGELFSIRTELFQKVEENVLLDDFIISLRVCLKGFKVAYEPSAFAVETSSASMKEEQKRKIRISAGGFQSMVMLKELLNPFKNFKLFLQYVSHRVLRWTLCPLLLPVLFIVNAGLSYRDSSPIYDYLFLLQVCFYLLALCGWLFANRDIKISLFYIPYYFIFMNLSVFIGFFRAIRKNQTVLWEKAARKKLDHLGT
jgi:biofilm PGA synthesis N-glycosyltransferase PgaC